MSEFLITPDYYKTQSGYQPIDFIEKLCLPFTLGNVVKYLSRAGKKDDNAREEIKKAYGYLKQAIYPLETYRDVTSAARCSCVRRARQPIVFVDDIQENDSRTPENLYAFACEYAEPFRHDIKCILIDIALWATEEWAVKAYAHLIDAEKHMESLYYATKEFN
jgi:hypothetical protein